MEELLFRPDPRGDKWAELGWDLTALAAGLGWAAQAEFTMDGDECPIPGARPTHKVNKNHFNDLCGNIANLGHLLN